MSSEAQGYRYAGLVKPLLAGKISLVTGASRGIGAATALKLAQAGSDLVVNYRSKSARAEEVAKHIATLGRQVLLQKADLTNQSELSAMMSAVKERFGRLDLLILNASGGLEKDKSEDYALTLNLTAQTATAHAGAELMTNGGRIVFVTSHWAHFYGTKPVMPEYELVARSKRAGEDALRSRTPEWTAKGISLVVVSGDAIEGTITLRLLARKNRGAFHGKRESQSLPTVDDFASAIVAAALDPELPMGYTVFVGSTDW